MNTPNFEKFGRDVAALLRQADGEPIFGRTCNLSDDAVVRVVKECADRQDVPHRHRKQSADDAS